MMFYLDNDMNLLIYGSGSKRAIMEAFLEQEVWPRAPSLLVRGYQLNLDPMTFLTDIVAYI